jgi:hypothetical protein
MNQQLAKPIEAEASEEYLLCPDCDSILEEYYDGHGNCKSYCDNCDSTVVGSMAFTTSDMDIAEIEDERAIVGTAAC